jgi:hypothetical protein
VVIIGLVSRLIFQIIGSCKSHEPGTYPCCRIGSQWRSLQRGYKRLIQSKCCLMGSKILSVDLSRAGYSIAKPTLTVTLLSEDISTIPGFYLVLTYHSSRLETSTSWTQMLVLQTSTPSRPPLSPPRMIILYTSPLVQVSIVKWKAGESTRAMS